MASRNGNGSVRRMQWQIEGRVDGELGVWITVTARLILADLSSYWRPSAVVTMFKPSHARLIFRTVANGASVLVGVCRRLWPLSNCGGLPDRSHLMVLC